MAPREELADEKGRASRTKKHAKGEKAADQGPAETATARPGAASRDQDRSTAQPTTAPPPTGRGASQPSGERASSPQAGERPPAPPATERGPSQEEIAARAYEIFQQRGSQPGREHDDWMQAEQELRSRRK